MPDPFGAVTRRFLFGLAGVGALSVVAAACADDAPLALAPEPTEPIEPGIVAVASNDNSFLPQEVTVAVGTTVRWTNGGANEHDILPAEGNPLTDFGIAKEDFPPKRAGVYEYTFTEPGRYDYFCSIHGNKRMKGMVGTVIVT